MRVRQKVILGSLLGIGVVFGGCETGTSDRDISGSVVFTLADVRHAIDTRDSGEPDYALLIDPRAPKYFAEGHMPEAVNLRLPDVREDDDKDAGLQRYQRLIVYGDNPGTPVAKAMFKRLLAAGYGGVRFYAGGMDEWTRSGGAVETSEPPAAEE